jgi:N-methylhydantoinase B/oxoprolinase/acetone carboxylase alpha subunit
MPCGGVGAPSERERELVLADRDDGIVTDREARDVYRLDDGGGNR